MYYVMYRTKDGKWGYKTDMSFDDAYKAERAFLYADVEAHIFPGRPPRS